MTETTIENYQERAFRTINDLGNQAANGAHMALGFTTEFGEMEEGIKNEDLANIREEHGDILWYLANSCNIYNLSFESIFRHAINSPVLDFKLHDLVDLHKREFAYGKAMDSGALTYQLVGAMQKLIIVANDNNFTIEDSLQRNISKLYQRFPNKFSNEDALNRDLDKEREILE